MMRPTLSDLLRRVHVAGYDERFIARVVKNLGGGRMPFVFANVALASPQNAVETVVITTPALNPSLDNANVLVYGGMIINAIGTAGTQLTCRIRQGTTVTGTVVSPNVAFTVIAGNQYTASQMVIDSPGAVAGIQYSMTGTVANASANSTVGGAFILALALG